MVTPSRPLYKKRFDALYEHPQTLHNYTLDTYDHEGYRCFYRDSEIARKIVDLIPEHALLHQSFTKEIKSFLTLVLRRSRVDCEVFILKNENNEIFIVNTENCNYCCEKETVQYNGKLYANFYRLEDGILRRTYDRIKEYEAACKSMSVAIEESNLFVMEIRGLSELINQDESSNRSAYHNRLKSIADGRSKSRGVAIDSDFEKLSFVQQSLSGYKDVFSAIEGALVALSGLPKTFLLGVVEASALSSSGSTDINMFEARVIKYREEVIAPLLEWLGVDYTPNNAPLFELDTKEKTEAKLVDANRVIALYQAGIISLETAQKELGMPIEAITPPHNESISSIPHGNTFSSDLSRLD
jgi:hypothetical protein